MRDCRIWLMVGALALAGCGGSSGGDDSGPAAETAGQETDETSAPDAAETAATTDAPAETAGVVLWSFNGTEWMAQGEPPACPDPIELAAPVDLSLATATLYPGQVRGGDYKPHGGFLFAGQPNDAITVSTPMDAYLLRGSRYIEQGEVQYMFDFVNSCGVMFRFDHLLTLTPEFAAYAEMLPEPAVDESRTTPLESVAVAAGTPVATAVGFATTANTAVDFGVYDLRQPNAAWQDAAFASQYAGEVEQAAYAVCWLDMLAAPGAEAVRALPPGDGSAGATSAYCA